MTATKKRAHITPGLASLHWIHVHLRALLITLKALKVTSYLTGLIHWNSAHRSLSSVYKSLLYVPQSRLKQKGDRAFAVAARWLWNQLPSDIRCASSISVFKFMLKTHFYSLAFYARLSFNWLSCLKLCILFLLVYCCHLYISLCVFYILLYILMFFCTDLLSA